MTDEEGSYEYESIHTFEGVYFPSQTARPQDVGRSLKRAQEIPSPRSKPRLAVLRRTSRRPCVNSCVKSARAWVYQRRQRRNGKEMAALKSGEAHARQLPGSVSDGPSPALDMITPDVKPRAVRASGPRGLPSDALRPTASAR